MTFNLERNKSNEIAETSECDVAGARLTESNEISENFDDCSIREIPENKEKEAEAADSEETAEIYDDCEINPKTAEEENSKLKENDDFSDCGKEADGHYVSERLYATDDEIRHDEVNPESQKAFYEFGDSENGQQLSEKVRENEHISVHDAESSESPENRKIREEIAEEECEKKRQETPQEGSENSEYKISEYEKETHEKTEKKKDETSESINETEKADGFEETSDKDTDTATEAKSETGETDGDKRTGEREAENELEKEMTEQLSEQTKQPIQERIDAALEKENITASEIDSLRDENYDELLAKTEEKKNIDSELKSRFSEVLSKEKGSDEYRQSLREYNALRDKKSEMDEQLTTIKKQQDRLELMSSKLKEFPIQKDADAVTVSPSELDEDSEMLQDATSKVLKRDELNLLKSGDTAIKQRLEAQADDYRDKGMSEAEIRDRLAADKWNFQKEFLEEAFPGQDVSPNVFNGLSENGSKDRLSDIENSETLREQLRGRVPDMERTALTADEEKLLHDLEARGEIEVPQENPELEDPIHSKRNLPTEKTGKFLGESGNSDFRPHSEAAIKRMEQYGKDTVTYKDGYPDFSPFTTHDSEWGKINGQVEIGHMTDQRRNPKWEFGIRPDGAGHDFRFDLGNFAQADNEIANSLREKYPEIKGEDIEKFRKENHLIWHELADGKTMQLVPEEIHKACRHSGGVSDMKYRMAWGDVTRKTD